LADFAPLPESWVLFGEIGLVLLVLEAGIDVDLDMLKIVGTSGVTIAAVGSVLPIGIGAGLAFAMGYDARSAVTAGMCFCPTSLGIALSTLSDGKMLNTPIGQLIVSAAVVDDIIALVILSILESMVGEITAKGVVTPIVSALLWVALGGTAAILLAPKAMRVLFFDTRCLKDKPEKHSGIEMFVMFVGLIALLPATNYSKASYLLGAFLAGLSFCTSHGLHQLWITRFATVLQWLLRIFFAASIGFQVPVRAFGNPTVIWQGLVFTGALLGKFGVGFMAPNFHQTDRFKGMHLRDCLIVSFSMSAEGEFAFVIAVFAVDAGLISEQMYASIILAILLSTIVPPWLLRYTINRYNRISENVVLEYAQEEIKRIEGEGGAIDHEASLQADIATHTALFLCVQTQSKSKWGLFDSIMKSLKECGLQTIDVRSWHPRGADTMMVNEIYARDTHKIDANDSAEVQKRLDDIKLKLESAISQPDSAEVVVQKWYPGIVEEVEEYIEKDDSSAKTKQPPKFSIASRLFAEADAKLEEDLQKLQAGMQDELSKSSFVECSLPTPVGADVVEDDGPVVSTKVTTPVVGGGLLGETNPPSLAKPSDEHVGYAVIKGRRYEITVSDDTVKKLESSDAVGRRRALAHDLKFRLGRRQRLARNLRGHVRNDTVIGAANFAGN